MKQVTAIFEAGFLPDFMSVLAELDIGQWTQFTEVMGAGQRNIHRGTPVWPGFNEVVILVLPEEKVRPLIDRCHEVRDSFPLEPGMKFIVTDCEIY